ncbi:hypothetical protein [Faecalibacterium hattorii]
MPKIAEGLSMGVVMDGDGSCANSAARTGATRAHLSGYRKLLR